MSLVFRQWQHLFDDNDDPDEVTTSVVLRSVAGNIPLAFQIDIKHTKETRSDFLLLQIVNGETHAFFQSFFRIDRLTECRSVACPNDVLMAPTASVTVYSGQIRRLNNRIWYTVQSACKALAKLARGVTTNYIDISLQPHGTYLELQAADSHQRPCHVDVISTGLRHYMLTDLHAVDKHPCFIILQQIYPHVSWIMVLCGTENSYEIPFDLNPASEYKLELFKVTRHDNDVYTGNLHSAVSTFTTHMTQNEVCELYHKAVRFLSAQSQNFTNISFFYRNKSDEYYSRIMNTDGVMHKYLKNWGGDQASTLNRKMEGLFFSTNVDPVTLAPPKISFFGSVRLHVPTHFLLNRDINMYFSDFYCHRVNHKVQIVLTVKGSPTDRFCRQRLVLLDQTNNPFLIRAVYGFSEIVRVTTNITVEVFYTEDVPIKALMCSDHVYFTRTKQKGNALAMVNGIPKNKDCRICNLDSFLRAHNLF